MNTKVAIQLSFFCLIISTVMCYTTSEAMDEKGHSILFTILDRKNFEKAQFDVLCGFVLFKS